MTRFLKKFLYIALLFLIIPFVFSLKNPGEVRAANEFNGVVRNENNQRLVSPAVTVECVSNCSNFNWVGDHFDVRFNNTGTVQIRVSNYPVSYTGCTYEILDRGPDINDPSDYTIIKTANGCDASFNAQYTNSWRYGVTFILTQPTPTPTPASCQYTFSSNSPGIKVIRNTPPSGWQQLNFNDSSWGSPGSVFTNTWWNRCGWIPTNDGAIPSSCNSQAFTFMNNPIPVIQSTNSVNRPIGEHNYFRFKFSLPNNISVTSAYLYALADDGATYWLNNSLSGVSGGYLSRLDVTNKISPGENIFAADLNNGGSGGDNPMGMQFFIYAACAQVTPTPTPIPTSTATPTPTPVPECGPGLNCCKCISEGGVCLELADFCDEGYKALCVETSNPDTCNEYTGCNCILDASGGGGCGNLNQPCCPPNNTCNQGSNLYCNNNHVCKNIPLAKEGEIFCDENGLPTKESEDSNGNPRRFYTAIGCIPVNDKQDFAKYILTWSLGIGGGLSFLLIAYGGFIYVTSGSDPYKARGGKTLIGAAITGLIMLILSVTLLRIIGVDILRIPGITQN